MLLRKKLKKFFGICAACLILLVFLLVILRIVFLVTIITVELGIIHKIIELQVIISTSGIIVVILFFRKVYKSLEKRRAKIIKRDYVIRSIIFKMKAIVKDQKVDGDTIANFYSQEVRIVVDLNDKKVYCEVLKFQSIIMREVVVKDDFDELSSIIVDLEKSLKIKL